MSFFKNPEVEKKYKNTNGDADPIVRVAIQYMGKLSNIPLNIADKVFADGGHIALRQDDTLRQAQSDNNDKSKK